MQTPTRCGVGFNRAPKSDFPLTPTNYTELNGIAPFLYIGKRK